MILRRIIGTVAPRYPRWLKSKESVRDNGWSGIASQVLLSNSFEFTVFYTGQRGILIIEIRDSEVWLYFKTPSPTLTPQVTRVPALPRCMVRSRTSCPSRIVRARQAPEERSMHLLSEALNCDGSSHSESASHIPIRGVISWIVKTVKGFMLPLSMSGTRVNKELLITTTSQVCKPQTIVNIQIWLYLRTSSLKNTERAP